MGIQTNQKGQINDITENLSTVLLVIMMYNYYNNIPDFAV